MNDALLVRGFQGLRNLLGDRQRLIDRNRSLRDAVRERRSLDQLHDERLHTVRLLQAVDVRDVRMVQRCEDLCFSLESSQSVRVRREGIREHLQGTSRLSAVWCARQTLPMPPSPIRAVTSYGPMRVPGRERHQFARHAALQLLEPVLDDMNRADGTPEGLPFGAVLDHQEPPTVK